MIKQLIHYVKCHVLGGSHESTFDWRLQEFHCNECGHRHAWKPRDIVS